MNFLPLPLFPEGSLASSVITTVWIGVFVVAFFNMRLGWVLSGLVVPGYMVPLLLVKPAAAGVVFAEGIAAYALVWFYSEFVCRILGWSSLFGRDRFFALVLASVIVRITGDGWLLPVLGEYANQHYSLQIDYRNNLHSFGLIIVALIANNFWKTGLRRGILPMAVTVGVTFLIVRFVLMEFTNFNISNLGYLYEDIAVSILSGPKAYIILLTTAFVASRMNLFYGWDFAGILVPSLLALQWYQPQKILVSFIEAAFILVLAHLILQAPMFRRLTIEGARKIVLFFNISFAYKLLLSFGILWLAPSVKISDYFGFGYLLPTLLAIKMHDKGIVARMTRATLQTSLFAVFIATLVGFSLTFMPDPWGLLTQAPGKEKKVVLPRKPGDLMAILEQDKIPLYRTRQGETVVPALPFELSKFASALKSLREYRRSRDEEALSNALHLLGGLNYTAELVESRYLYLSEKLPRRNWGTYVIDLNAASALTVEVPAPLDERGSYETGGWLFRSQGALALAIAGASRTANRDGSSDVLVHPETFFHVFHQEFGWKSVLQVRAWNTESVRVASGLRRETTAVTVAEPPSTMFINGTLPEGFAVIRFREMVDKLQLAWRPLQLANLQRDATGRGFAELRLARPEIRSFLGRAIAAQSEIGLRLLDRSIEGYLQDWLFSDKKRIAPLGSNFYRKPGIEELLFFDDEIISPILAAARNHYRDGAWTAAGMEELRLADRAANAMGYEIVRYRHRSTGRDFLILSERELPYAERRYWGTYVFRLGPSSPFVFQVPRPIFEINSFEFGVALFETTQAAALLIGGSHPFANQDYVSDIVRPQNKENLFNTVHQVILREAGDAPMMVVQSRAMGIRNDAPVPVSDLLLAHHTGVLDDRQTSPLSRRILNLVGRYGLSHEFAGGSLPAAGYEVGGIQQSLYLNASQNKEFMIMWLSPLARSSYQQQTEPTPQSAQMMSLGIPSREIDLAAGIAEYLRRAPAAPLPDELPQRFTRYLGGQDIVVIREIQKTWPKLVFERWVDINSRQGFLAVLDAERRLLGIANLTARSSAETIRSEREPKTLAVTVARFVDSRAAWLIPAAEKP